MHLKDNNTFFVHTVSRGYRFVPIVVMFLLTVLFFYPILFQGKTFYAFDNIFSYLPWSSFIQGFHPQNPLITDPIDALYPPNFYPSHFYYQAAIKSGEFTFWSTSNFCGIPYTYYSYPFSYLFFTFLRITTAHDLILFIHLFGAGLFTYLYLKKIGLDLLPSMIGAISWMFNGYVMVWFEFEHVPILAMTLSATLLCIELWWERRSMPRFIGLTCAISLSICTLYAHLIIYQLLFVGMYILFKFTSSVLNKRKEFDNALKLIIGSFCAILVSMAISANFFTSHVMMLKNGQREPIPYNRLFKETGQLPVKYLATLLFPDIFGSPASKVSLNLGSFVPKTDKQQTYNNYNELCIYAGIIPFLLAISCIPYLRENKQIRFFFSTASLCLLMAMGSFIYYPLAKMIPGLNLSTPTRILYLFGYSISILAALGAQILQENRRGKRLFVTVLWVSILMVSIILVTYIQTEQGLRWAIDPSHLNKFHHVDNIYKTLKAYFRLSSYVILKPILVIFTSIAILSSLLVVQKKSYKNIFFFCMIILLSYDLISFGNIYNASSPKTMEFPQTPAIKFLKKDTSKYRIMSVGNFLQNSFIPFGIDDIGGYGSFYPKRYGEYISKSQQTSDLLYPQKLERWIQLKNFGSPLLDLLNVKYLLTAPAINIKSNRLELVYDKEIKIYRNLLAFPRVFYVPGYELAANDKDAYRKIGRFTRDEFAKKVILESLLPKNIIISKSESNRKVTSLTKIVRYKNDKIEIEVSSNSDGFLVISDNYHHGWVAHIDGEKVKIMRANYIMRSIPVKAGKHMVKLEFKPKMLIAGWGTTLAGWTLIFCVTFGLIIRAVCLKYFYKNNSKQEFKKNIL